MLQVVPRLVMGGVERGTIDVAAALVAYGWSAVVASEGGPMVRELERDNHIVSLRLTIPDRPGVLGQVATRLGDLGANILQVGHRRLLLDVPAKGAKLDVTIETRDAAHAAQITAALAADNFKPERIGTGEVD